MKAYQVKIELKNSKPLIWRRVRIATETTFQELHDVIQNVLNFKSGYPHTPIHQFQFELRQEKLKITNDEEAYQIFQEFQQMRSEMEATLKALNTPFARKQLESLQTEVHKPSTIKIDSYLEKYGVLNYLYDFEAKWEVVVTLEELLEEYPNSYPALVAGEETAPPENVGGLAKFYDFLEVYGNPSHEDHEQARTWAKEQEFKEYDPKHISHCLKTLGDFCKCE